MYIATAISREKNYLEVLEKGLDFHSINALNAFEEKMVDMPKDLTREQKLDFIKENYGATWRYYAKALGFSLLYGASENGLSHTLNTSKKEAKNIIDMFLGANKGIKSYIDDTKKFVHEHGYVENHWGLRVYLPECINYNPFKNNIKKDYKAIGNYRFAVNTRIQSANAFLLYEGLIKLDEEITKRNLKVNILTTIYDAVYFEIHKDEDQKAFAKLLREVFEVKFLDVDMKIDVAMSDDGTWYSWENIKL